MGQLASAAVTRRLALCALSIYAAANVWRALLGHSELVASNRNASSASGGRESAVGGRVCC